MFVESVRKLKTTCVYHFFLCLPPALRGEACVCTLPTAQRPVRRFEGARDEIDTIVVLQVAKKKMKSDVNVPSLAQEAIENTVVRYFTRTIFQRV